MNALLITVPNPKGHAIFKCFSIGLHFRVMSKGVHYLRMKIVKVRYDASLPVSSIGLTSKTCSNKILNFVDKKRASC